MRTVGALSAAKVRRTAIWARARRGPALRGEQANSTTSRLTRAAASAMGVRERFCWHSDARIDQAHAEMRTLSLALVCADRCASEAMILSPSCAGVTNVADVPCRLPGRFEPRAKVGDRHHRPFAEEILCLTLPP